MKKVFVVLSALILLAACKKEEKKGDEASGNKYVGTWLVDDIEFTGSSDMGGQTISFSGEGENYVGGYTLREDGSMEYNTSYDLVINLAPLPSQTIPVSQSGEGTWRTENNNLILSEPGSTQIFPIKVATENILIVEQDSTFDQGGITAEMELEITLVK